ncbi:unnamed protein product [Ilex paraguariensis]|uniref:O-methyltransferase n=1 Tax=Ilex paraguariensis TaxID=185542 RepID=A0ABC8TID7_9AQUA
MDHIFNFINSMSLKCAIQLDIPNVVHGHGRPMTLSELVDALSINRAKAHCVCCLMRILVHSDFFVMQKISKNDDEEGYFLSPASQHLVKDNPLSLAPFLLSVLDPILIEPWHYMTEWLQNDDHTPFETAHGRAFWAYADDGDGTGTVGKAIADAFPHLKCTVFDLPHVVAGLEGNKNLSYVAGDMFEALPTADALLLKWILYDWSDEESLRILKKYKEAISIENKGGKIIIIDMVLENQKGDDNSIETELFLDMLMMVLHASKERNEKEWAKLFFDAGFTDYKITPVLGLRSLIEVYP